MFSTFRFSFYVPRQSASSLSSSTTSLPSTNSALSIHPSDSFGASSILTAHHAGDDAAPPSPDEGIVGQKRNRIEDGSPPPKRVRTETDGVEQDGGGQAGVDADALDDGQNSADRTGPNLAATNHVAPMGNSIIDPGVPALSGSTLPTSTAPDAAATVPTPPTAGLPNAPTAAAAPAAPSTAASTAPTTAVPPFHPGHARRASQTFTTAVGDAATAFGGVVVAVGEDVGRRIHRAADTLDGAYDLAKAALTYANVV